MFADPRLPRERIEGGACVQGQEISRADGGGGTAGGQEGAG